MNINYYIEDIYNKVRWGDLEYRKRIGNLYYFYNDKEEVCYDIIMNSISTAKFTNSGKEPVIYINSLNMEKLGYDEYLYNSFIEIILEMVISESEMDRLNDKLNDYIEKEEFEKASKQRDVIDNIKIIMDKL